MLAGITGRKNTSLLRSAPPTAIKDILIKVETIFHKVPTFSSAIIRHSERKTKLDRRARQYTYRIDRSLTECVCTIRINLNSFN